uniref:(northern house mosquito) hypothetical protein n=1 Tax=Culex pipiens TaxID=7175 RepID=A0A8D8C943_CULPI
MSCVVTTIMCLKLPPIKVTLRNNNLPAGMGPFRKNRPASVAIGPALRSPLKTVNCQRAGRSRPTATTRRSGRSFRSARVACRGVRRPSHRSRRRWRTTTVPKSFHRPSIRRS